MDTEVTPEELVDVICARWATAGITMLPQARELAVEALYGFLGLAEAADG